MALNVNFFDGAESGTTPTIGNIVASDLVKYADDASFEASEQGAPQTGNIYYNTTLNLIRYYNGTGWISVVDEESSQTVQNKTIDGTDATGNNTVSIDATDAVYDNSTSGLVATNAQTAIDEVEGRVDTNETNIATNATDIDDLETLSGSPGAVDHGLFTGSTISDNTTTKGALQELENEVELKLNASEKGAPNGVAELDGSGLVPAAQLPSYVDDVLEFADLASFPATGETGKIYVALDTNKTYRWTGATYIEISASEVVSVNGQTGTVSLTTTDVPEGTNEYYTEAKVDAVIAGASIDELSDVDTTTTPPTEGQALVWDNVGSNWVPGNAGSGSGAGSKTYFEDGDFENSIGIASVYDDGGAYVDGTGGTPTALTISQTSFSIAGDNSLQIDKAGVDATGEGVTLLTQDIDVIDLGKELFFSLAIDAADSQYVDGDIEIRAYDVSNSQILTVVPVQNLSDSNGVFQQLTTVMGKVLTTPTTTSIRLSLHVVTDSSPSISWTLTVDEARIGPDSPRPGSIVTEWQQYTPTFTAFGSVSGVNAFYRRVGDSMELNIQWTSGTATASQAKVTLPTGFTIPNSSPFNNAIAGRWYRNEFTGGNLKAGSILTNSSNLDGVLFSLDDRQAALSPFSALNGTSFVGTSQIFHFYATVKIEQWSAGNLISASELAFSTPRAKVTGDPASASAGNPIIVPTVTFDSTNSYDNTTGLYTAPSSGTYMVHGAVSSAGAVGTALRVYRNALDSGFLGFLDSNGEATYTGLVDVSAGDTISVRPSGVLDAQSMILNIHKVNDYTQFGTYGTFEVLSTKSANKTFPVTNASLLLTGNSLTLTPGTWRLEGLLSFFASGGSPNFTNLSGGFFAANGNDTTAVPANLNTLAGITLLNEQANGGLETNINGVVNANQGYLPVRAQYIRLTQTQTIYLVPRATMGSPANATANVVFTAERLQ